MFYLQKPSINVTSLQISVLVTIGVMLLLVLSMLFVFMLSQRKKAAYLLQMQRMREEQQNMLIEAAVRSEESERHRIAEELHDEVGAMLSATKLHFSAIQTPELAQETATLLARSKELLNLSIQKVRSISHNLHSSILKELGLHEAIRHFFQTTVSGGTLKAEVDLDDDGIQIEDERAITIYRLVQELINNILKHSGASIISLATIPAPNRYVLRLMHDGHGLTQDAFEALRYSEKGLGLKNIQNRMILLKGDIHFYKQDASFVVDITVPENQLS